MNRINDIYEYLCALAPLELQMDFDNSGFQLGDPYAGVSKVLLALDVTDEVVAEAKMLGAELIISHHPLIFRGLKCISNDTPEGARLIELIRNGISVISMHTNFDIAQGGVNDVLIELLGAKAECALDGDGGGRVGCLAEPCSMDDFLLHCREALNTNGIRYYSAGRDVYRLAVLGGAGGDELEEAYFHGCDTYVTSDIKYHQFLRAEELGINLIDADHFCTENPVISVLCEKLFETFPGVEFFVSEAHDPIIQFMD